MTTTAILRSATSRRTVVSALGLMLAMAAPLGAQTPAVPPAQASSPQATVLPLSMEQAVTMGLETNLGLKSAKLNVDVAAQSIIAARASFLPQLRSSVSRQASLRTSSSFTDVTSSTISNSTVSAGASLAQQLPWYGGAYQLSWNNGRSATNQLGVSFNPTLSSSFSVSYSQPLLQGFLIDGARVGLETSEAGRKIADLELQQQVVGLQAQIRDAYLNLIGSIENRKVVLQNMDSAQQQLNKAQAQVKVGTAANIDVIQAEANVASNQVSVIGAEAQVAAAQDSLRALILDPSRPDYWQIEFDATDQIDLKPFDVDIDTAVKNALANRLDVIEARQNLAITDLNVRLDENLTKPSVNANASYSASGTGGTQLSYDTSFPPHVISTSTKGFGSVLGDTFGGALPSWSVGLNVAYPLGRSSAQAGLARAQIQKQQQQINMRDLELQVVAEVRQFARDVKTSLQRVQAAQAALKANELQDDAAKRQFAVGLIDTFTVLQKQQLLAQARLTELQARISYNQAILNFEKVQKIR